MKPLSEMGGETLTWTHLRPGYYQLRGGEGVFAQLRYQTALGSLAIGTTGDERWTFKRTGLQRPRITVRQSGCEKDIAVLKHSGRGEAVLDFATGRRFVWRATRVRRRERGFYDPAGELVVRFSPQPFPGRAQARVELARGSVAADDMPLLVVLGWYRLLIEIADQVAAPTPTRTTSGRSTLKRHPPGR
jgi:hypothetical protein